MKIIGTTATGFLLDATRNEVVNITGEVYPTKTLTVGTVIDVGKIYNYLTKLSRLASHLTSIQSDLRQAADLLDGTPEFIERITK
jgi:hypothetical protein